ncbi:DUF397 domain-containing protein [Streptomyces cucumeris]|uniref:DUF397 domain-containing protein n=1 Tax=Streptomyces cucumeris TaxID=2962890 RepID=UPI0020C855C4|nr:DUF397 domain-containing protein [Streptomyces sp. NEAU-Y11]MCP9211461.1 DUF397 domain-containing protein [Streptomyces sp. NEAU-Y11]
MAPESAWFKSSYSSGAEGNCVEVADLDTQIAVRDSKRKDGPALRLPRTAFSNFIDSLK